MVEVWARLSSVGAQLSKDALKTKTIVLFGQTCILMQAALITYISVCLLNAQRFIQAFVVA